MNFKDIKERWIAALRSGKYKQAKEALRVRGEDGQDRLCCLGVLCDVVDPDGWTSASDGALGYRDANGNIRAGTLPPAVGEMVGLDDTGYVNLAALPNDVWDRGATFLRPPATAVTLSELNDRGASFELIADVIEACLKPNHEKGEYGEYRDMPEDSIIREPGKFEQCARYVPELWGQTGDGTGVPLEGYNAGNAEVVTINDADRAAYPELAAVYAVVFWESDQGFVHYREMMTEEDLAALQADMEAENPYCAVCGNEIDGEDELDEDGDYAMLEDFPVHRQHEKGEAE